MFWKPKLLIFERVSSDVAVLEIKTTDFQLEIKNTDFRPRLKRYLCFGNQNYWFSNASQAILLFWNWKPQIYWFSTASQAIFVFWELKLLIFERVSSDIGVLEIKTIDFRLEIKNTDFRPRLKRYWCFGNQNYWFPSVSQAILLFWKSKPLIFHWK